MKKVIFLLLISVQSLAQLQPIVSGDTPRQAFNKVNLNDAYLEDLIEALGGGSAYDGDPTIIQQDATHRFATDVQIAAWNAKADANHNHNALYAALGHNHDSQYSDIDHDHDASYSLITHNHDADYSLIDHNHDLVYSLLGHNHDADYIKTSGNSTITNPVLTGSATITNVLTVGANGIANAQIDLVRSAGGVVGRITQMTDVTRVDNVQGSGLMLATGGSDRITMNSTLIRLGVPTLRSSNFSASITASTALDVRGTGTTSGFGIRIADSGNTPRFTTTDNGQVQILGASGTWTVGSNSLLTHTFSGGAVGNVILQTLNPSFTPNAGVNNQTILQISPTYNNTGTHTGTSRGIYYSPTNTSLTGTTHIAFENTSGQLRFGGVTQDDTKTQILAKDASSNQVFWRDVTTIGGGGGGLSDGDYGDISVGAGATTLTVDNLAITDAKINDVAWGKVTGEPTTLGGYGITDAASATHNHDASYALITHDHDADYSAIGHNHDATYSLLGHNHAGVYQPVDADLTAIAGLAPTNDDIIQRKAGAWINRTMAQLKTDLGLVKSDVGLSNVDNTSDANKPISTATQSALDLKANLASPTFTGTPSLPTGTTGVTQSAGNSTTALATTAFVTTADNLKANLAGPTFTGTVVLPSTTSIGNVSNTEIGHVDGVTSAIQGQIDGKQATLVSGTNIKTINGTSILGSGDISTGGGSTFTAKLILASAVTTGANTTPVNLTGMTFTYEASSTYLITIAGSVTAAAATTGYGFGVNCSTAPTEVAMNGSNVLANTGTVTTWQAIANNAIVGVTSGIPSVSPTLTATTGSGIIITNTAGTAQFIFRSETTAAVTCRAGLVITVLKIN